MESNSQKVSIVGYGNVGSHLAEAFSNVGIRVSHICTRTEVKNENLTPTIFVTDLQLLPPGQLTIVCVQDGEIERILKSIPKNTPVAYTSGAVKLESLTFDGAIGVFYPLQSFTKGISVDVSEIPFFIESDSEQFGTLLFELAKKLSKNVKYADSNVRAKLHLAGVWVNNFTNHVNYIAKDYLDSEGLDFEDLKPLLKETIRKIEIDSPFNVQTGPARRGDVKTIEKHLTMLNHNRKEIYALLSDSILKTYTKNDEL